MNPLYLLLPAMGAFCCPSSHDPGVVCITSQHFRVLASFLQQPAYYTYTHKHTHTHGTLGTDELIVSAYFSCFNYVGYVHF